MKILWLKTELLHPVDKGGKIRTYEMLREIHRDHEVVYLTLDDGTAGPTAADQAAEYCCRLVRVPFRHHRKFSPAFYAELAANLFSPMPYFLRKYRSPAMRRAIAREIASFEPDVVVSDFLNPAVNMPTPLGCPSVLFQHNVEAMIWKRHVEVQKSPLKKAYLYLQWRKAYNKEGAICRAFDHIIAVSEDDRRQIAADYGCDSVSAVPTGVDFRYFMPDPDSSPPAASLVFTGSMDWLPNQDAIGFFIDEVFPVIRAARPDAVVTIAGRNAPDWLVERSKVDRGIVVTGRVPDVRPYMAGAQIFIVPIRIGGGTRLKIYEAMSMELPVVSTTVGAEGLPVDNGKEIVLADTAADFAAEVLRLIGDDSARRALGKAAGNAVRTRFGWNRAAELFVDSCRLAIGRHAGSPAAECRPRVAVK